MSYTDACTITVALAPDWLTNSWRISQKNGTEKLTVRQINDVIAEDGRRVSKKVSSLSKRTRWRLAPIDLNDQQKDKTTRSIYVALSYQFRLPSNFAEAPGSSQGYGFLRGLACRP